MKKIITFLILLNTPILLPLTSTAMDTDDGSTTDIVSSVSIQQQKLPVDFRSLHERHGYSEEYKAAKTNHTPLLLFTPQPAFPQLKNQPDQGLIQWEKNRQARYKEYKDAHEQMTLKQATYERRKKRAEGKLTSSSLPQRESVKTAKAESTTASTVMENTTEKTKLDQAKSEFEKAKETFETIQKKFLARHFPLTIEQLGRLIYSGPLNLSLPYKKYPKELRGEQKVKSYVIKPENLDLEIKILERITQDLEREQSILEKIHLFYEQNFLTKVKGWSTGQLKQWYYLSDTIINSKKALKESVDQDFPLNPLVQHLRDESTDKGFVLARMNRDDRGKYLRLHLLEKIRPWKEPENNTSNSSSSPQSPSFFERVYTGVDSVVPLSYEPEPKMVKVKTKDTDGIERLTWVPGKKKKGNPSIMIPFSQIKKRNYEESSAQVLPFSLPTLKGLDRKNGVIMAQEYRPVAASKFHRSLWYKVIVELAQRKKIIDPIPDIYENKERLVKANQHYEPLVYSSQRLKEYNALYQHYETLLERQQNNLHKLLTPYGSYTYIPYPYTFFYHDNDQAQGNKVTSTDSIDLTGHEIKDADLLKKRPDSQGDLQEVLYCYKNINLSYNNLYCPEGNLFHTFITHLNISHNNILSVKFITELKSLQFLDISHNQVQDIGPLITLQSLTTLDLSHNLIEILNPFEGHLCLESLKVGHNNLKGAWREKLPKINNLRVLEILGNEGLNLPTKEDLKCHYPKLESATTTKPEDQAPYTWEKEKQDSED